MSSPNLRCGIYDINTGFGIPARSFFTRVAEFFDNHPSYTRIASQIGFSLDAMTFPAEVGQNAYGVWRKTGVDTHDVLVAYTTSSAPSPGGTLYWHYADSAAVGNGVGFMVAWHSSSVAWQGTTNDDGSDFFVDSPWKPEAIVLPSENSHIAFLDATNYTNYRAYAPNKNLLTPIPTDGIPPTYYAVISADENNFYIGLATDTEVTNYVCFQRYTPTTSSYDLPYTMQTSNVDSGYVVYVSDLAYGRVWPGAGGGVTIRKNTPDTLILSTSFDATVGVTNILQQIDSIAYNLRDYGPNNTSWIFSPLLFSSNAERRYLGYPDFMLQAPGYIMYDRVYNGEWLGVGYSTQIGVPNCIIPWSLTAYTGSYPTGSAYSRTLTVATGSTNLYNAQFTTMSNIFSPIVTIDENRSLYRGRLLGNFYYGNDNPPIPSATEVTVVREFADDP